MTAFVERVAEQATSVRPLKLLLTVLAVPFYVLGWILGLLYVAALFAIGAVKVGIADARARASQRTPQPAPPDGDV